MRSAVLMTMVAMCSLCACQSAQQYAAAVQGAQEAGDRLSVGKVQREIRVGMTNAQVVEALGSPNMVTTDEKRRESWVYDRVATENAYSTSTAGVGALILGAAASAGASATTQRSLTIIVKFDEAGKVRDFAYRSSSF